MFRVGDIVCDNSWVTVRVTSVNAIQCKQIFTITYVGEYYVKYKPIYLCGDAKLAHVMDLKLATPIEIARMRIELAALDKSENQDIMNV